MNAIHGTYIDGKIVPDENPDWPEGKRILLVDPNEGDSKPRTGMREEDWPTTPEGIAALVAQMDQIRPFLTPEEEAAWHKALSEQKAYQLSHWEKWCKESDGLFE
jgi:hypothetical protein